MYLFPTFISENHRTLPEEVITLASCLDEFIVENEKSARQFLKSINTKISQKDLTFHLLNEHSTSSEINELAHVIQKDKDIGFLSEAGCPVVADPGAALVRLAHQHEIRVLPMTGPSSILLALMASGFSGQSFVFHGYLPRDSFQRKIRITQLEKEIQKKNQTQVFIETPYRNQALLQDILATCSPTTQLCIACELTSKSESVMTRSVAEWKKKIPDLNKKVTVFLLGAF